MAYTDKTAVKAYLGIVTTDDDALLDVLIPRAQAIIDAKTGRTFEAASDSVRYFSDCDVSGATLYLDHDLCAITSITNGDGETITEYTIQPRNRKPWHMLTLTSGAWSTTSDIAIAGRWAYMQQADAAIQHIAVRLTAWLYRQKDNHTDMERTTVVGNMTILPSRLPADIDELLHPYRRLVP